MMVALATLFGAPVAAPSRRLNPLRRLPQDPSSIVGLNVQLPSRGGFLSRQRLEDAMAGRGSASLS